MITDKVIKEIYRKFRKTPRSVDDLKIPQIIDLLKSHHSLRYENGEIIIDSLEEFNPFRRLLARRLYAILEFDRNVAFVTPTHILFLGKDNDQVRVHMKPEKSSNFLSRIFSR